MLPGPEEVIACPHCDALARQATLRSGNNLGAIVWSDGKQEAPMLPDYPAVTRCHRCRAFYWVADARVIGEIERWGNIGGRAPDVPDEWLEAPMTQHLTVDDYHEAIDQVSRRGRKERYLRLRFWWALNDFVRQPSEGDIPSRYRQQWQDNLARLASILKEKNPDDKILKAEVARQRGNFAEAIQLLQDVPDEYRRVAGIIMQLATEKDSRVRQVQPA